ncbi:MAG: GntR family transcriptional regulator [Planctomycetes bacterium]|nr:GntR family transcriptional regulator [Planctomycetota bacterium]MBL7008461.1 GntR family transcriptional regulator [Planctomycetota bacterium]
MHLHINPGDEVPIYRQIVRQIRDAVAGGELGPGHKLLSHRDLATQLVIAPLTVKKAYDELELQGLVETRRGLGSFITASPPAPTPSEYRERLREAAQRLLTEARLSGAPLAEVIDLLEAMAGKRKP